MNLTERLREYADHRTTANDMSYTMFKAADRIEALEAALRNVPDHSEFTLEDLHTEMCIWWVNVALPALQGEKQ